MMAGVHDLHSAADAIPVLTSHGYIHGQHRPATLWFRKAPTDSDLELGLHLTEPGSSLWRERLAFRDALRTDPLLAQPDNRIRRTSSHPAPTRFEELLEGVSPGSRSDPGTRSAERTRRRSCGKVAATALASLAFGLLFVAAYAGWPAMVGWLPLPPYAAG